MKMNWEEQAKHVYTNYLRDGLSEDEAYQKIVDRANEMVKRKAREEAINGYFLFIGTLG